MEALHRTCNRCGGPNGRRHRWCADCKRDYDRRDRARAQARTTALLYVRRGLLKPEPCCVCGAEEGTDIHHEDPAQPLRVLWVCLTCEPLVRRWQDRLPAAA